MKRKWPANALVIVFCVSGAAFSLNLFRLDLFQSIASQNKKPMGTVIVKYNNVQRRFSDRVLWSRLNVESPVYSGDLIRVAEYSAATLNINNDIIDINENSMIHIRAASDGEYRIIIDLVSGDLSVTSSDDAEGGGAVRNGVALNVMGYIIEPTAKTTLSVSAKESGMTVQVNEGTAAITGENGYSFSMDAGEAFILDANGVEQAAPAAVVMLPHPNARFIKNNIEPVNIRFWWNTLNIDQRTTLLLEIAAGPNFTRIVQTAEGVNSANISIDAGIWHWRLSYQDAILSSGKFTIVDAAMEPASPIQDSLLSYRENMPVRFEWKPVEEASYYIFEAGLTPDIINPLITRQTVIASYVEFDLEAGTWYWRVKPVFSSLYEGNTVFSQVTSFRMEKPDEPVVVADIADNSAAMPAQPEPEPLVTPNLAGPVSPSMSNTGTPAVSIPNHQSIPEPETPSEVNTAAVPMPNYEVIPEPVTPPASNKAAPVITNPDAFISSAAGWKTLFNSGSKSDISIARETIDGAEREVLTISINLGGGTSKWAGATLTDENFFSKVLMGTSGAKSTGNTTTDINLIRKLVNANGVRFKALGDGKRWRVYFPTINVTDGSYHGMTISTQNGKVSNIDISFKKLNQPDYGNKIGFSKNNLKGITIERNSDTPGGGASVIKIFDFEVY